MFSLLTLLDDVATTLDDVAVMTKVAMKKTSALMSDDLAVNAGVVVGVNPDRELPIVRKIFLGSLVNKVICISLVLFFFKFYPPVLKGLLLLGGLYLSFEGAHKVLEKLFSEKKTDSTNKSKVIVNEKEKIWGAIKTDLILSMEIVIIAKSSLKGSFLNQTLGLIIVGLAASIIIYGLVALLVKIDDLGLHLIGKGFERMGKALVLSMPKIMKGLGILGTLAMFLVGGGIFKHIFHLPLYLPETLQNLIVGLLVGLLLCGVVKLMSKVFFVLKAQKT